MARMTAVASLALAAFALAGCAPAGGPSRDGQSSSAQAGDAAAIRQAVAAPSRTPANLARDRYRHPAETLGFFGIRPDQTVVELWPGGGWYTEILAPLLAERGRLIVAPPAGRGGTAAATLMASRPEVYGKAVMAEFPAGSFAPPVAPGSADLVLTFRNVHNWRFGGEDRALDNFRQIAAMLKPGGRLGIVEHRLPEDMPSAMEESSGYMKVSSVRRYAEAAGLVYVGASDINANPADTHDWPRGVWTLPPVSRGAAEDPARERYLAVGESDRMTLLFIKPAR